MDREAAEDRVKQDFVESMRLFGVGVEDPDQMKAMIENIIDRYEQYREHDEAIDDYL